MKWSNERMRAENEGGANNQAPSPFYASARANSFAIVLEPR